MKLILCIVRLVLSIRYKVHLSGTENLRHNGPLLILPNHVALVDPRILISFLGKYIIASPVASEKYYNLPVLRQAMQMVGTVPIGEMTAGAKAEEVKKVFYAILEGLKNGKNILIYPSGQIYRQSFESIKGKQSTYFLVNNMPENTKVIGIRTRGLWGSLWSKARDNGETTFTRAYIQSIKYAFANLLFFVPKRKVEVQIFDITEDIKKESKKSLTEFNTYLEHFYNADPTEKLLYIKHFFYYDDVAGKTEPKIITGSEKELSLTTKYDISIVPESVKNEIIEKITLIKGQEKIKISDSSRLVLDLFFDSLDTAEIKSYIQTNFKGASNPPITDLKAVSDLYMMAIGKSKSNEKLRECIWREEKKNSINLIDRIKNKNYQSLLTIWKKNFSHNKNDTFLWDNILGIQTKRDFLIKAYFIANRIKKLKGEYIGIMMPSVGGASLLIIATYLAGKIPVMFNWTLGKEAFNHCVKFSKVENIVTVSSFYERVKNDFLDEHNKKGVFLFLEELLKGGSLFEKICIGVKSMYMPISEIQETAVILFTSGSENLPKAVPLTHENLIENIAGALNIFALKDDDKLLGILPPFHSFGFTVNTIMPLISGLKVAYTPDPNDAKTILEIIVHTKVTALTATPTFLKMIMALANPGDLKSLKYVVVGAERCPEDIFEKFQELCPSGVILEGYGITECSPVISINPIIGSKPATVGKIIPNLDCKIVNTEKPFLENNDSTAKGPKQFNEAKTGNQGMIYVSGSSIFHGYLDDKLESPFEDANGKIYYKTGDLGLIDDEGFLTITGRLKRFIKIAGEMISLPFIENILLEKYGGDKELKIAIEAIEKNGNAKIVLFSIEHIEVDEVNDYLRKRGVSNLVKISEIITIKEIPILGTGKVDYKVLKKIISV